MQKQTFISKLKKHQVFCCYEDPLCVVVSSAKWGVRYKRLGDDCQPKIYTHKSGWPDIPVTLINQHNK
jgi:hypothetical protein